jgi:hypothetical protein
MIRDAMIPSDAALCADVGADAPVVSSHGGRQLGCSPPMILVLWQILAVASSPPDILFDGDAPRRPDFGLTFYLGLVPLDEHAGLF